MTTIENVDTVVIGAGHAGLAVSRLLTEAGHDHVVLDRGRVGERWRTERWDSLHLLTPAWMTRLPGWSVRSAANPDGFLPAGGVRLHLERYAASFGAPVVGGTTCCQVVRSGRRRATRSSPTGAAGGLATSSSRPARTATPHVPAAWPATPSRVLTSNRYRNPGRSPRAASSWWAPRRRACRSPTSLPRRTATWSLAVGRHTRMPRRYRGMDAFWWLETIGRLARTIDDDAAIRTPPDGSRRCS